MPATHEEKRRSPRRAVWSRAMALWLDGEESYTLRGHVRDISPEGCSLVSLTALPASLGAIAAPGLDVSSRYRVTHTRRVGLVRVTGLEFLASIPRD